MWADGNGRAKAGRISLLFAISATKNVADALAKDFCGWCSWGRAGGYSRLHSSTRCDRRLPLRSSHSANDILSGGGISGFT